MGVLNTAMKTARSGIDANARAITVVGNNIANANTVGYKAERVSFADVVGSANTTVGSGAMGVRVQRVGREFQQGALMQTGVVTDLAIEGEGFFVLRTEKGPVYTRVGQFGFDADGVLRTPDGGVVQGFAVAADGTRSVALSDVRLSREPIPPQASTRLEIDVQLDANAPVGGPFDPTDPAGSSTMATSTTVYDSLGNAHVVNLYFVKTGTNQWEWHAMVDGGELVGGTAGTLQEIASGTLGFTSDGRLDTESVTAPPVDFLGATPGQTLVYDFGDSLTTDGATQATGATQFAGEGFVRAIDTDGFPPGELTGIRIDKGGEIVARYDNGQERVVAVIALASFPDPSALTYTGEGRYMANLYSGQATVGGPGTSRLGVLQSGYLEQSTVDVTEEIVNLINFQRAFQANSRVIGVADEMLVELVNLRR